jgi:hypothetical protein
MVSGVNGGQADEAGILSVSCIKPGTLLSEMVQQLQSAVRWWLKYGMQAI